MTKNFPIKPIKKKHSVIQKNKMKNLTIEEQNKSLITHQLLQYQKRRIENSKPWLHT